MESYKEFTDKYISLIAGSLGISENLLIPRPEYVDKQLASYIKETYKRWKQYKLSLVRKNLFYDHWIKGLRKKGIIFK